MRHIYPSKYCGGRLFFHIFHLPIKFGINNSSQIIQFRPVYPSAFKVDCHPYEFASWISLA